MFNTDEFREIILASASPRRAQLLQVAKIPFEVIASPAEEVLDSTLSSEDAAMMAAKTKAQLVQRILDEGDDRTIVACDTVVVIDGTILGKPHSAQEAARTLSLLSGRTHHVISGVCLLHGRKRHSFFERTAVTFYELSSENIRGYIDTTEPFDKAGSYGIQGQGALLVKRIEGDYFNVVGLPLARLVRELLAFESTKDENRAEREENDE